VHVFAMVYRIRSVTVCENHLRMCQYRLLEQCDTLHSRQEEAESVATVGDSRRSVMAKE
jgi:hypothetical protein